MGLDNDASWNTVSAFTGSCVLTFRTPKPPSIHHLVLKHDGDRETRNRSLFNLIFAEFLDFPHSLVHSLGCYLRFPSLRVHWQMDEQQYKRQEAHKRSIKFVDGSSPMDMKQNTSALVPWRETNSLLRGDAIANRPAALEDNCNDETADACTA